MLSIYRRLYQHIKPHIWLLVVSAIANALYSAVDAGMIKLLQPLIDDVFVAKDQGLVQLIPIVLPLAFLLRGSMSFVSDYGMAWISRRVVMELRQQVFAHLQVLPATFYDNISSGQLLAKLTYNVDQVAKATTDVIVDIIRNTFLIVFLLGVMFWTSWRMTLLFMVVCPLVAFLFRFASKRFRRLSHRIQDSIATVTHLAEESIEGYKVVRTFNGQSYEKEQFAKATERNRQIEMKMIKTKAISQPLIQLVGGLGLALTVYAATSQHSPEVLTAGAFATLMSAMVALLNPIKQLTSVSNKIQQGLAGIESVYEILNIEPEPDHGTEILQDVSGAIEFKNLEFVYPNTERKIIDDLNLSIAPGETVAFVGRSGAGKSTLMSLLLRFYDGYDGKITIDGHDIRELTLQSLRNQCAFVSQHVSLFNDTIANNISYGQNQNFPREQIIEAAKAANAYEFIMQLPNGFDTQVGENGVLLSGGQRQRLSIARALCKQAPILILDEATSALDGESEAIIQDALEHLMKNKTCLVIAHRLSTIENADKIAVLQEGKLVEMGPHASLLAKGGFYTKLHQAKEKRE